MATADHRRGELSREEGLRFSVVAVAVLTAFAPLRLPLLTVERDSVTPSPSLSLSWAFGGKL